MIATTLPLLQPVQQPKQQVDQHQQGDLWDYISPSRLNCWSRCPLAFKFRYVEGIQSPPTPALFLGKRVHEGLELWYRHKQLAVPISSEQLIGRMSEQWDAAINEEKVRLWSATNSQKLKQQAAALVQTYLHNQPIEESKPLAVEASLQTELVDPINGEALGIDLLGVLDVVFAESTGAIIADFKTAASSTVPHELQHEVQLTAYAYLFRETTGAEETSLEIRTLVKTKTPRSQIHAYDQRREHHFARFFALVREYLDALERHKFNYRPGWHCANCEHRDGPCHAWSG